MDILCLKVSVTIVFPSFFKQDIHFSSIADSIADLLFFFDDRVHATEIKTKASISRSHRVRDVPPGWRSFVASGIPVRDALFHWVTCPGPVKFPILIGCFVYGRAYRITVLSVLLPALLFSNAWAMFWQNNLEFIHDVHVDRQHSTCRWNR